MSFSQADNLRIPPALRRKTLTFADRLLCPPLLLGDSPFLLFEKEPGARSRALKPRGQDSNHSVATY